MTALASLAVLIVLLLCVPLDMAFHVDVHGKLRLSLRMVWLFGLVSKKLEKGKKKAEEEKAEAKPRAKKRRISARTVFAILRTKGLVGQFKHLLKDIMGCFRLRDILVSLKIGLDDPADTGLVFAVVGPVTHFLSSYSTHVRVQPVFGRSAFEGFSSGKIRLRPVRLFPPLLRFVFSLPTVRAVKTLVLTKWKRKK